MNSAPVSSIYERFHELMPHRIFNILLVSSPYDYFILEKDGLIEDKLFYEYSSHNIKYTPRIRHVSTAKKALELLKQYSFDAVFCSIKLPDMGLSEFVRKIKARKKNMPFVLLANVTDDLKKRITPKDMKHIDDIFVWTGDAKLFFAVAKLLEDKLNVDRDIEVGNVRVILMVEDEPRFYSMHLPTIYGELLKHVQELMEHGLNTIDKTVRVRSRPKILLAKNYEEAVRLIDKYKNNLLGVISDVRFPVKGKSNEKAGFMLTGHLRSLLPQVPIVLQSSEIKNQEFAADMNVDFINKNSNTMLLELKIFILDNFGYGDFIFRDVAKQEVQRISSLPEMRDAIETLPGEILRRYLKDRSFLNWLFARGAFGVVNILSNTDMRTFKSDEDIRTFFIDAVDHYRNRHQDSLISDFKRESFDPSLTFVKLGSGSVGGKARGLAFMKTLLASGVIEQKFPSVRISVPKTMVIGSDEFDLFIEKNHLSKKAFGEIDDQDVRKMFMEGRLSESVAKDLMVFLSRVNVPFAVRSSSLFEDSQDQPFAGLYETYMLPNNHPDIKVRFLELCGAIKSIYSSPFSKEVKSYFSNTAFRLEEEKMSVIIQELVGKKYGNYFYPNFAGVGQSFNYYPLRHMLPEDGTVNVALGFGKTVVEGGGTIRFCPKHPTILPQIASTKDFVKFSQRKFYALDLTKQNVNFFEKDDDLSFPPLALGVAKEHGTLNPVGGIYVPADDIIYDGAFREGVPVVNFSNVLKNDMFPLAEIMSYILKVLDDIFGGPIEMEFAVNISNSKKEPSDFYLLQVRPFLARKEYDAVDIKDIPREEMLCQTSTALGNGRINNITDVVYVVPQTFNSLNTFQMAQEVSQFNQKLSKEGRPYLLIGIGRWGTKDHSLGIPVSWDQISGAEVIIEASLKDFIIEPSNGTHFFHNLTACKTAYMSINPLKPEDFMDWDWLNAQHPCESTQYVRHIRFPSPVDIKVDGRSSKAVIVKPSLTH